MAKKILLDISVHTFGIAGILCFLVAESAARILIVNTLLGPNILAYSAVNIVLMWVLWNVDIPKKAFFRALKRTIKEAEKFSEGLGIIGDALDAYKESLEGELKEGEQNGKEEKSE